MKYALPALSLLATTALATPIPDAVAAAPPAFKINKVVYGGSGCPQGTIDVDYTNSAILPIYFSKDFTASVGPNIVADQSRKNCQLNIDILYSPGYSFSVYSADYMGWGDLDDGVKGVVKAQYYFSGQTQTVSLALALKVNRIRLTHSRLLPPWSSTAPSRASTPSTTTSLSPSGRPAEARAC